MLLWKKHIDLELEGNYDIIKPNTPHIVNIYEHCKHCKEMAKTVTTKHVHRFLPVNLEAMTKLKQNQKEWGYLDLDCVNTVMRQIE